LAVDRGPPGGEGPSHGTTGTMVNPALLRLSVSVFWRHIKRQ